MFWEFVTNAGAIAMALIAIATVVGAVWAVLKKPWRTREADRLELQRNVAGLRADMTHVRAQLGKNGGESVRDSVDRIEHGVSVLQARVATMANIAGEATFECDTRGHIVRINEAAEQLTGLHLAEFRGLNWINVIAVDERESFRQEFFSALTDQRAFAGEVHIMTGVHVGRRLLLLRVQMWPMRVHPLPHQSDRVAEVIGWMGKFEEVEQAA